MMIDTEGRGRPALFPLVLAAAAVLGVGCGRAPEPTSGDSRTAIPLTVEQRGAVLSEMRTMLGSLNGVLGAVTRWDTAGIRAAALRSGTAAAADPALEKILPEQWMQMALRTHGGFDSLAASAGRPAPREAVVAKLAAIVPECVNCHATYRLAAP